jgi:hypothetical protein
MTLGSADHVALHSNVNDDVIGLATKLGIGASPPNTAGVLRVTNTGTQSTGYGLVQTGDVASHAITQSLSTALSGQTTTSTTMVDITGSSFSFTGTGGLIVAIVSLLGVSNTSTSSMSINWNDSSVTAPGDAFSVLLNETVTASSVLTKTYALSIGGHSATRTYKLRWSTSAGSLTFVAGWVHLLEFKR